MSILEPTMKAVRMAGTALGKYATDPATLKALGTKVAIDTALGTAASQAVPLILGQKPSMGPMQAALHAGTHSLISSPVAGGMKALGIPSIAAESAGSILGGAGAQIVSRTVNQGVHGRGYPVSESVVPEVQQQYQNSGQVHMQLQQMAADQEQQRYNNEINLARAKNYHAPATTVVHKNPSADFENMLKMMAPKARY
jgi:hypothetical protein